MPATQYTCEYRFESRPVTTTTAPWAPVTEELVCEILSQETPDPRDLNNILIEMRKGAEADAEGLVFRAVPVGQQEDLRVIYTTAKADYDGFGTKTLVQVAGIDKYGREIRKVGIRPEHYEWQTLRYGSGMHPSVTERDLESMADIWTIVK